MARDRTFLVPWFRLLIIAGLCAIFSFGSVNVAHAQYLIGIDQGGGASAGALQEIADQETWLGKTFAIVQSARSGIEVNMSQVVPGLLAIWNQGSVPLLTWRPCAMTCVTQPITSAIANGQFDSYLNQDLSVLKTWLAGPDGVYGTSDDRRLFLRFDQEMNGHWWPESPGQNGNTSASWIAMWQHVVTSFRNAGLDSSHVAFVWCPNSSDNGSTMAADYPGDPYVDWLGLDGYSRGDGAMPSQVFGFGIKEIRSVSAGAAAKPLGIYETGFVTKGRASLISAKGRYITNLYTSYAESQNIKDIEWFNSWYSDGDHVYFGCDDHVYPKYSGCPVSANRAGTEPYGNTTQAINGTTYLFYSQFKTAVLGSSYPVWGKTGNPRILTDAQFAGNFVTSPAPAASTTSCRLGFLASDNFNSTSLNTSIWPFIKPVVPSLAWVLRHVVVLMGACSSMRT